VARAVLDEVEVLAVVAAECGLLLPEKLQLGHLIMVAEAGVFFLASAARAVQVMQRIVTDMRVEPELLRVANLQLWHLMEVVQVEVVGVQSVEEHTPMKQALHFLLAVPAARQSLSMASPSHGSAGIQPAYMEVYHEVCM
jgi:hypothetical protein